MKRSFHTLAVSGPDDLLFGRARRPVTCGFDVTIGAGAVYPEVNFTLPAIAIEEATWPQVVAHYEEMACAILRRATALQAPAIVLEFELLPAMTETPEWGAEITALLRRHLQRARESGGVPGALRVYPDRHPRPDQNPPPALRDGEPWQRLHRSFDLCVSAGADIISIESVGGKEVHDRALMFGDLTGIVLALGVLAPLDMAWLWERIVGICGNRALPGGDTACGFANTAMQLAHQRMLPEVLAAVVRAMSAVRSLVAFEQGAVGPSKDCAYEGPILKAITGSPIAMEGKSATCAHFSPVGNIAAAMCDLWSNESVQNVRLLSGSAPEAFTESLVYDCRLMNIASAEGGALMLRNWLTRSDEWLSPQAAVLSPAATVRIASAIVAETEPYQRVLAAGRAATEILREGLDNACLKLSNKELGWLTRIESELKAMPDSAGDLLCRAGEYTALFDPRSYGL